MAAYINTNIASLNAQRNLSTSQSGLATSLQRLSSGLRINSAKDDAAGLAISSRFTTQINGLDQASRNANDAISLSQTAEGALGSISDNLQRIRELAVQASNSTNSASDRATIDQEVQQRLAEIDRTASQTSFNGQKILDGTFGTANFQVGANAGETISMDLSKSMRMTSIGAVATATSSVAIGAPTDGSVTISPASRLFGGAAAQVDAKNEVTLTPSHLDFTTAPVAAKAATVTSGGAGLAAGAHDFTGDGANAHINITDEAGNSLTIHLDDRAYTDLNDMASSINQQLSDAGSSTTASFDANGKLVLTSSTTGATAGQPSIDSVGSVLDAAGLGASGAAVEAAGQDANSPTNAAFKVGNINVSLTGTYADQDAVADAIQTQLRASDSSYSVTNDSGVLTIKRAGSTSAADVAITGADAGANAAGIVDSAGTAGSTATSGNAAHFDVDGTTITLNADYTSFDQMATAIKGQLGTGYTVSNNNGAIKISKDGSIAALSVTNSDSAAIANVAGSAGTAGGGAISLSDLTITAGNGKAVNLSGSYKDANELADSINKSVSGVYATVDQGKLTLTSSEAVKLGGSDASKLNFGTSDIEVNSGSLSQISTLTVDSALTTLQRVDSALNSVNSLRSTFGAAQNRFESVISNLSTSSENMTAARSRIQDADFAAETAAMTRNQILQQAGTAMLAQANSLPNGVLSLLRG